MVSDYVNSVLSCVVSRAGMMVSFEDSIVINEM